ncbi:MAG: glycoside hydrolase family protein [Lachnospiraceae bacterium]|nr:glycoside hydrolase family protein [Lachnospiraceae bacterium]
MNITEKGLGLIKEFEGCQLTAYKCPADVWTIGYGHTGKDVVAGLKITKEKAEKLLKTDLATFEKKVDKYQEKYNWNQNEFDALVSFAYNVGNIDQLTKNGSRTKEQIAESMLLYNKAAGKELAGLTRRRKAEQELFLTACKTTSTKATDESYKVIVTAKNGLNVRKGAGTNYGKVKVLKHKQKVTITKTKNGWGKISDGWICLKYTEKI